MDRQEQERQDIERIMRHAAELGHDPERVARAVNLRPPPPIVYQHVMEIRRRSRFGAYVAARFARRA